MIELYFLSDPHFDHDACVHVFKRHDGSPLRDFPTTQAMNDHIIDRINAVVTPQSHLYIMGDVAIKRKGLEQLARINCKNLRLLCGNHDIFKTKEYFKYFEEIKAMRVIDNILFTHVPVHPMCMERFSLNVHGHLHHQLQEVGEKYLSVSVEMLPDYTPRSLSEIKALRGL
jgi:calcineurin-like phosphoesterase family protein